MTTDEADAYFDDCAWNESMNFLPDVNHLDFWKMYCMGREL